MRRTGLTAEPKVVMNGQRPIAPAHARPGVDERPPPRYRPRRPPSAAQLRARRRMFATLVASLAAVVLASGSVYAHGKLAPFSVTVDGQRVRLAAGSTLGQAVAQGAIVVPRGTLMAVDGGVLPGVPGPDGTVIVNGVIAGPHTALHRGDNVVTVQGPTATEETLERTIRTPYKTVKRGSGDKKRTVRKGKKGVKLERYGEHSGVVVSAKVISKPVNKIVEYKTSVVHEGDKVVALTFDDGPWGDQTVRVLDVLDRYDVKATFFMVGTRVAVDAQTAAQVARRGHALGNHSYSHPDLVEASNSEIRSQVRQTNAIIKKATGKTPRWFRAPGGAVDEDVRAIVSASGMRIAHWTIGTGDWKKRGPERIVRVVRSKATPGAVILMHDGGGDRSETIEALPRVIQSLRDKGYRFVTLDQLPSVPGSGGSSY